MPRDIKDPFTASDRHGKGVVWKDKTGFIHNESTPSEDIEKRASEGSFVLCKEIEKVFIRKKYLDAYHFIYGYMMRHIVPLMNIEHRIERVDFGVRYAVREYSESDYALLMRFFKASTLDELRDVYSGLQARYNELISDINLK